MPMSGCPWREDNSHNPLPLHPPHPRPSAVKSHPGCDVGINNTCHKRCLQLSSVLEPWRGEECFSRSECVIVHAAGFSRRNCKGEPQSRGRLWTSHPTSDYQDVVIVKFYDSDGKGMCDSTSGGVFEKKL
ncbi:hypothetical protein J6590_053015 [Homalodisca vitripennis]|nr:hypothetical protein J6590_053015 [Homalodisca vitripennis]